MGDIVIETKTVDEHLEILGKLLDRFSEYNLELNHEKSVFLYPLHVE